MRFVTTFIAVLLVPSFALAQPGAGQNKAEPALKSPKEKASYGFGLQIGENLKRFGFDIDLAALTKGISDALAGAKPALSANEVEQAMATAQQEAATKQADRAKVLGEKNKTEGAAFHAENKKKEGVTTLPSGLQFKVVKSGTGKASPKLTDTVTTHYKGTLLDGTVFDSSFDRGEPATFPVSGVIPGWTEALQKMKVGDKWQLFIPGNLAYGDRGAGGKIGPNATLVFEIELIAIEPEAKP